MKYKLILEPLAAQDAMNAANWYNKKRDGLGNEFLLALEAKLNTIQRNPGHYQKVHKNIRRGFTARFPYGVYFLVEYSMVHVISVTHLSIHADNWSQRK